MDDTERDNKPTPLLSQGKLVILDQCLPNTWGLFINNLPDIELEQIRHGISMAR